jgi:hypothetical protein
MHIKISVYDFKGNKKENVNCGRLVKVITAARKRGYKVSAQSHDVESPSTFNISKNELHYVLRSNSHHCVVGHLNVPNGQSWWSKPVTQRYFINNMLR